VLASVLLHGISSLERFFKLTTMHEVRHIFNGRRCS